MDKEAVVLRRELARVEKGRGKRYPEQSRRRVMAWAVARRAAGASWERIKRDLGKRFDTVRRWCAVEGAAPTPSRALVPVHVVPDAPAQRTVAVVSPGGFRVDGLTLSEAAALLYSHEGAVRVWLRKTTVGRPLEPCASTEWLRANSWLK